MHFSLIVWSECLLAVSYCIYENIQNKWMNAYQHMHAWCIFQTWQSLKPINGTCHPLTKTPNKRLRITSVDLKSAKRSRVIYIHDRPCHHHQLVTITRGDNSIIPYKTPKHPISIIYPQHISNIRGMPMPQFANFFYYIYNHAYCYKTHQINLISHIHPRA
jgi:hypothetical protein